MIEVIFSVKGELMRKTVKVETVGDFITFIDNFESEIIKAYPDATNIRLGNYIQL